MTDNETASSDPVRAARVEQLTQALVFALLTANEQPYPLAVPAARKVAEMLDDCGVRQTGEQVTEIELPGWMSERVREDAAPTPVEPDHFAVQETRHVVDAPAPPSRIAKKYLAEPSEDASFGGVVSL
ncbi:hypothetical protein [Williamsia phyllosphaerae]|uniref:Uncharacterized protein n=1 Tax=Williamsia phyllosphaerae TaxID=885042 RepID=A0ABQ1V6N1_9NOCA|nr:hypothetical protein [Williamsia phyllosphaerae]GGF39194.1 hypothetical protein GCM10007298_38600 [Williamsia phyllosphaerae]